jgi:hypothetical protein
LRRPPFLKPQENIMNTYTIVAEDKTTYATNANSFLNASRTFELYPQAILTPDLAFTRIYGDPMPSEEIQDMGWIEVKP